MKIGDHEATKFEGIKDINITKLVAAPPHVHCTNCYWTGVPDS